MPQMSPILWVNMLTSLMLMLLSVSALMYFNKMMSSSLSGKKFTASSPHFNWSW